VRGGRTHNIIQYSIAGFFVYLILFNFISTLRWISSVRMWPRENTVYIYIYIYILKSFTTYNSHRQSWTQGGRTALYLSIYPSKYWGEPPRCTGVFGRVQYSWFLIVSVHLSIFKYEGEYTLRAGVFGRIHYSWFVFYLYIYVYIYLSTMVHLLCPQAASGEYSIVGFLFVSIYLYLNTQVNPVTWNWATRDSNSAPRALIRASKAVPYVSHILWSNGYLYIDIPKNISMYLSVCMYIR